MSKKWIFLFLLLFLSKVKGQTTELISEDGQQLQSFYRDQNVENLWLAYQHVDWKTGQPDDPNNTKAKTHCSAFVASACYQAGIYILRPPEHKQALLANAQADWLASENGKNEGWRKIDSNILEMAQILANDGYIVVASYKNNDTTKPGHIALVFPALVVSDSVTENGPKTIQAGKINATDIYLKQGFQKHLTNWNEVTDIITFYYFSKRKFSATN